MRWLCAFLLLVGGPVVAQDRAVGLEAWDRLYEVASHPRCTNCHVGPQEEPMWEGLVYGTGARHGMNILAGDSRIGAETIPCRTCHVTSDRPNSRARAAPQILEAWRLPPVELAWLGASSADLCRQMRDPDRNDGHDIASLIEHVRNSPFVAWSFTPGGGRVPAPGSTESFAADLDLWGAADMPCR
ncbi:MAG: hypothetical protein P1U53_16705 [Sulfitobacter sp.]|nr:hypothetical protein [Sulfitobacter sp.]